MEYLLQQHRPGLQEPPTSDITLEERSFKKKKKNKKKDHTSASTAETCVPPLMPLCSALLRSREHELVLLPCSTELGLPPLTGQLCRCLELTLQARLPETSLSARLLPGFSRPSTSSDSSLAKNNRPKAEETSKVQRFECFNLPSGRCNTADRRVRN